MSASVKRGPLRVVVTPFAVEVDGAKVYILELSRTRWVDGQVHYIVSCQVEYRGWLSPVFQLDVVTNRELLEKLRIEVAKMKLMILTGLTSNFRRAAT